MGLCAEMRRTCRSVGYFFLSILHMVVSIVFAAMSLEDYEAFHAELVDDFVKLFKDAEAVSWLVPIVDLVTPSITGKLPGSIKMGKLKEATHERVPGDRAPPIPPWCCWDFLGGLPDWHANEPCCAEKLSRELQLKT